MKASGKQIQDHLPKAPRTGAEGTLPPVIGKSLRRVAARQTRVSLGECGVLLLTVLPALLLFQGVADWWFNLPWAVRLILLVGDCAAAGTVIWRFGVRPLRHRITLEGAALRVESVLPEFRSSLISAVELARPGSSPGSPALVRELHVRVAVRVQNTDLARRVVSTANLKKWSKWALISVLATGICTALFWPKSRVLMERILLSQVPLPTRTVVVPISRDETVVVGADLTLAAKAEGVVPRSGMVMVVYANKDRQEIPVNPSPDDPATFQVTMQNVQQPFSYRFLLNDGVGADYQVQARTAPVLETFRVVQNYPAYTGLPETEMSAGNLALLAGSTVRIEGRANQPLREGSIQLEGVENTVPLTVKGAEISGEFPMPGEGLTGFSLPLTNQDGITSQNDTVYAVQLIPDRLPEVELLTPTGARLSVLLRARPRLVYSVRDDFGLKTLTLKYEVSRPAPPGGREPDLETGEIALPLPKDGEVQQVFVWDLAGQKPALTEGCTLTYWIEAEDNNSVTGPGVGQTDRKTLSILSEADKRAELLEILGARASEIDEISETQKTINEELDRSLRKTTPATP